MAEQQTQQPEDSRCPPTYRREEAVKALIAMGWAWDGAKWAPQEKAEPVAWIRPEDIHHLAKQNGVAQVPAWNVAGDGKLAVYTAPPAERVMVPDGWKLVPERIVIEASAWESAQFAFDGPGTGEGESYTDCTLWVGDIDEDDGSKTHGLHLSCNEVPEEGSVTLAKFSAPPAERVRVPDWLRGLGEAVKEASSFGFWRPCSGCYETEDGHPVGDYPYSDELQCAVGGGCSECGGLGAVWDETDYEALAQSLSAAPEADHG